MELKVIHIVGTRPQFIKLLGLVPAFNRYQIPYEIINTGQHFSSNMSSIFLDHLSKKPKYQLDINSGTHGENTGRMIVEIEKILLQEKPTHVIVYGDCDTTLAGAVACSKIEGVRLLHLESGCRSNNRYQPEEVNRIMVDSISDELFCATPFDVENLIKSGQKKEKVHFLGHLHYDLLTQLEADLNIEDKQSSVLKSFDPKLTQDNFLLVTVHRKENTTLECLTHIFSELGNYEGHVLLLVHPRIQKLVSQIRIPGNFLLRDPVNYETMLILLKSGDKIITDSGGLRFEALYFNKTCIVLRPREQSEWAELEELNLLKYISPMEFRWSNCKDYVARSGGIKGIFVSDQLPSEIICQFLLKEKY